MGAYQVADRKLEGEVIMGEANGVLVTCVLPHAIPDLGTDIRWCLGRAVHYSIGGETVEFIEGLCFKREAMLWAIRMRGVMRAMIVTDELRYPSGTALRIRLAGGVWAKDWIQPFADACAGWARKIGAVHVEVLGRPGWIRMVRRYCSYGPKKLSAHMMFEVPRDD